MTLRLGFNGMAQILLMWTYLTPHTFSFLVPKSAYSVAEISPGGLLAPAGDRIRFDVGVVDNTAQTELRRTVSVIFGPDHMVSTMALHDVKDRTIRTRPTDRPLAVWRTHVRYTPGAWLRTWHPTLCNGSPPLEAALEPLGLAEAHRPKFYAVRYQVEAWERTRMAGLGSPDP